MARIKKLQGSGAEDAPDPAARRQDNAADSASDASDNADASPAGAPVGMSMAARREQFAEIARQRAEHFARGGAGNYGRPGARSSATSARNVSSTVAAAPARPSGNASSMLQFRTHGESPAVGGDGADGEEQEDAGAGEVRHRGGRQQWPGPFATALALMQGRDAAARQREQEADANADLLGSAPSSSARKKRRGGVTSTGDADVADSDIAETGPAARGIREADYTAAAWKPSRPLPGSGATSKAPATAGDDDAMEDGGVGTPGGSGRKRGRGSSSTPTAGAGTASSGLESSPGSGLPAADEASGSVRRAIAIAGPSGVKLGVPSLTSLCIDVLVRYMK